MYKSLQHLGHMIRRRYSCQVARGCVEDFAAEMYINILKIIYNRERLTAV
jgi:hypothetical protein